MSWYYTSNGKQYGPATEAEVRFHISSGSITPTDTVKVPGTAEWVSATEAARHFGSATVAAAAAAALDVAPTPNPKGSSLTCFVLGIIDTGIGLYFLLNPSVDSGSASGQIANIQLLAVGQTFAITGAIFLAAAIRPRD